MSTEAKGVSDPLDLELQVSVNHLAWVLETKLRSPLTEHRALLTSELSLPPSPPPPFPPHVYPVDFTSHQILHDSEEMFTLLPLSPHSSCYQKSLRPVAVIPLIHASLPYPPPTSGPHSSSSSVWEPLLWTEPGSAHATQMFYQQTLSPALWSNFFFSKKSGDLEDGSVGIALAA